MPPAAYAVFGTPITLRGARTMPANRLSAINHIVVFMLENRSFDHMLGFLYAANGNVSPATGQPFEGLTGQESNAGSDGASVTVFQIDPAAPNAYFMPGAIRAKVTTPPTPNRSATSIRLHRPTPPTGVLSPTSGTPSAGRQTKGGPSCLTPRPAASWACSRLRPCQCCLDWRRVSPCATIGSARRPPRLCRTAPLSSRAPRRVTWTTKPSPTPAPAFSRSSPTTTSPGRSKAMTPSRSLATASPTPLTPTTATSPLH